MRRYANYLAGLGYASIFGFSFLVTKGALARLDPFELLFLRFALAALLMSALAAAGLLKLDFRAALSGTRILPGQAGSGQAGSGQAGSGAPGSHAYTATGGRSPALDLALACLFQPLLYFAAETFGVRDSASSTAGLVLGALPAAVALLGAFMLKERLGRLQAAALGLSVAGVALIVLRGVIPDDGLLPAGEGGSLQGLLFLLGALASASFYNIYSRRASRAFTPAETTFAMMWAGAIAFGAVALAGDAASGRLAGPGGLLARALPSWPGILYLGALSSVLAFFFINFTLSRLKASQSVVFASLTTVISVAAGVILRGESFGALQGLGAAMIVVGVWGTNAAGRPRPAGPGTLPGGGAL